MASQQAIASLNYWLKALNWEFSHPKIQEWLQAVSKRCNRKILSQAALTDYQCLRLARFCEIIHECDRIIKHLKISWQDPTVKAVFVKYDFLKSPGKMTINGWEELYTTLDQRYKDFMPF